MRLVSLAPARIAFSILLLGSLLAAGAAAAQAPDFSKRNFNWLTARLESAYGEQDHVAFVAALTTIARKFPARLEELTPQTVLVAFSKMGTSSASPDAMVDLYESLFAANWNSNGVEPASLQSRYIRLMIDRQEWSKAGEVLRRVRSPGLLLQLKSDLRAGPLVQAHPESFDIEAQMSLYIKELEAAAQQHPRRLSAWSNLFYAYLDAGRYRQILAVTDQLLAAAAREGGADKVFEDPDSLNWTHDHRARAWRGLGEWESAEREFRIAADMTESGDVNVSNALNLASLLADMGKEESALQVLASVSRHKERVSAYGRMTEMKARYIAALSSGDQAASARALDYLRANRKDSRVMLIEALIRAQEYDEAAAEFALWIADPETRWSALAFVQEYTLLPPLLPSQQAYASNRQAWASREDVRAAIAKVGRIETVSMAPDWL